MAHSVRKLLTHSSHVFNNTEAVSQYHIPFISWLSATCPSCLNDALR